MIDKKLYLVEYPDVLYNTPEIKADMSEQEISDFCYTKRLFVSSPERLKQDLEDMLCVISASDNGDGTWTLSGYDRISNDGNFQKIFVEEDLDAKVSELNMDDLMKICGRSHYLDLAGEVCVF